MIASHTTDEQQSNGQADTDPPHNGSRATDKPAAQRHTPVLLERCVELLSPGLAKPGAVFVDATLGLGGHTEAILTACPEAIGIGIDRDPQALDLAIQRLGGTSSLAGRFTGIHAVSDDIPSILAQHGLDGADAVLFDLGVSSLQLDEPDRGFAYRFDAPLDMRMDPTSGGPTAAEVLNSYLAEDLARLLRDYGEERYASKIARAIASRRTREPFRTSGPLVELLHQVVPAKSQRSGGHPAKRTFQALRIEVNAELTALPATLTAALRSLRSRGRIVVLAYHSLEDRITKRTLAAGATSSAPPGMPVELPEQRPWLKLLVRGAEQASADEVAVNPRSAPVRLRAAERIRSTPDSTASTTDSTNPPVPSF